MWASLDQFQGGHFLINLYGMCSFHFSAQSLVPACRRNRGFLRLSDVWDSYDQWEHRIPDGRRFLRRVQKNRKHFYLSLISSELSIIKPGSRGFLRFSDTGILTTIAILMTVRFTLIGRIADCSWYLENYE